MSRRLMKRKVLVLMAGFRGDRFLIYRIRVAELILCWVILMGGMVEGVVGR